MKYSDAIEDLVAEYAERVEEGFWLMYRDTSAFEARLRSGIKFTGNDPSAENKIELTRHLGLFSYELFQAMICGGESYKPVAVRILWDRLCAAGIAMNSVPAGRGIPFADHQLDQRLLFEHLSDDTFANIFSSAARLPDRYKNAVAAVDVTSNGTPSRGTGFVVRRLDRQFFVTCGHNVDPAKGVVVDAITSAGGDALKVDEMALSAKYDIAVARLKEQISGPCFVLYDKAEVFDEVFTLGFPYIPCAEPLLLGHRGEVNGRANLYLQKCPALIISNLVSPGSSGGPVLGRDGRCVGLTINWLEGDWDGKEMRFSAALPAGLIIEAVEHTAKS